MNTLIMALGWTVAGVIVLACLYAGVMSFALFVQWAWRQKR